MIVERTKLCEEGRKRGQTLSSGWCWSWCWCGRPPWCLSCCETGQHHQQQCQWQCVDALRARHRFRVRRGRRGGRRTSTLSLFRAATTKDAATEKRKREMRPQNKTQHPEITANTKTDQQPFIITRQHIIQHLL